MSSWEKWMRSGVPMQSEELAVLKGLPYAIIRKDRLSYIYDFS